MAKVKITWVTEVTETYSIEMDEADLLEEYGTTDPGDLKDLIDAADFLAGDEDSEHEQSSTVENRYVDQVELTS